jgi:small-conductance mechanosensitive channel
MSFIESIQEALRSWLATLMTFEGASQLVIIIVGALFAWMVHGKWQKYTRQRLGESERTGFMRITVRGTVRLAFPLAMLLFILAGRGILLQLGYSTIVLNILVPLLLSLAAIRLIVYVLRRVFTPSPALRAWEGVVSTVAWSIVAFHLLGWLPDILNTLDSFSITLGDARISLLSGFKFLIAIAIFIIAANWLSKFIEARANRSPHISPSMRVGLTKFSKFFFYTLAILFALDSVGIDLTTLAVFGGALGVGLGFGLQRIASNFISGFILLFDRSIRPGDVISIGDRFGLVKGLHARYIVVRDRDGVDTLIPNENLITSEVTNWSYGDRAVRVKIPVQISYADDPVKALQIMEDACAISTRILNNPEPAARLIGFGDNGINLELRIWMEDPEEGVGNIRSELNLEIWKRFKEEGITIPFPQRDVRIIDKDPGKLNV